MFNSLIQSGYITGNSRRPFCINPNLKYFVVKQRFYFLDKS